MKNLSLIVLIFLLIISALIFNLFDANKKIDNYFELNNQIIHISQLNTKLQEFSKNNLSSQNYKEIQVDMNTIKNIFFNIENNKNYIQHKKTNFYKKILSIKILIEEEIEIIEKMNSFNIIFNKSIKNIQILKSKIDHNKFDKFYNIALTLNYQKSIDIFGIKNELNSIGFSNKQEENFISNINVIFDYYVKKEDFQTQISNLNLFNEINTLHNIFEFYMQDIIKNIKKSMIIFIVLLSISILLFIYYAYSVLKNKMDLDKFKSKEKQRLEVLTP